MAYPEHLLPKSNYCCIPWKSELHGHYLLRTTPSSDIWDTETNSVRGRYVLESNQSRENLKDYSTNLLGVFTTKDAAVKLTKSERKAYLIDSWAEGEIVEPPAPGEFDVLEDYGFFFYKIGVIHGFPKPINLLSKPQYTEARCYVCHTPVRSNFWHFSVQWKIGQNDIAEVLSRNEIKGFMSLIRSFLIENAIIDLPLSEPSDIPEDWFTRKN